MQIKKYNISKPKKYTDKQNQEKTQWNNIGTMTEFYKDDGSVSRIIEIPAIGLDANIFPMEEKSEGNRVAMKWGVPSDDDLDATFGTSTGI